MEMGIPGYFQPMQICTVIRTVIMPGHGGNGLLSYQTMPAIHYFTQQVTLLKANQAMFGILMGYSVPPLPEVLLSLTARLCASQYLIQSGPVLNILLLQASHLTLQQLWLRN